LRAPKCIKIEAKPELKDGNKIVELDEMIDEVEKRGGNTFKIDLNQDFARITSKQIISDA
jgi:hypothetical protein